MRILPYIAASRDYPLMAQPKDLKRVPNTRQRTTLLPLPVEQPFASDGTASCIQQCKCVASAAHGNMTSSKFVPWILRA